MNTPVIGNDLRLADERRQAAEARRPTIAQRRAERVRLLELGRSDLIRKIMEIDDRTWNELLPYSADWAVDVLMDRWEKDGWIGTPSGKPFFLPNFAEVRAALNQLPASSWEGAQAALDDIERFVTGDVTTRSLDDD